MWRSLASDCRGPLRQSNGNPAVRVHRHGHALAWLASIHLLIIIRCLTGYRQDTLDAFESLKADIETQVQLAETPIRLGGVDFNWYRVENPDHLLDAAAQALGESAQAEIDPFWAATWRAALGLDRFLGNLDLCGTRVLELGCGSGQAGVGAAKRGAQVTMTDIVSLAMKVAQLNAWPVRQRITFERLHWAEETLNQPKFPIIIGSDLVYDTTLHKSLMQCASKHLEACGSLYLSEPNRHTGDAFSHWVVAQPWEVIEHQLDLADGRVPIRIFECKMSR